MRCAIGGASGQAAQQKADIDPRMEARPARPRAGEAVCAWGDWTRPERDIGRAPHQSASLQEGHRSPIGHPIQGSILSTHPHAEAQPNLSADRGKGGVTFAWQAAFRPVSSFRATFAAFPAKAAVVQTSLNV